MEVKEPIVCDDEWKLQLGKCINKNFFELFSFLALKFIKQEGGTGKGEGGGNEGGAGRRRKRTRGRMNENVRLYVETEPLKY